MKGATLRSTFEPLGHYSERAGAAYSLLPLRFLPLDSSRYIVTNVAGEHVVLSRAQLNALIRHELSIGSPEYEELKARHFLLDGDSSVAIDLLAAKCRTKQSLLARSTSLFMFVVTLRCEHSCRYCQVSRQSEDRDAYDMPADAADEAVDFMFKSPSRELKVEFQGGEPLLNFELIKRIVARTKARNSAEGRRIEFVVASNLAPLTDEHLTFFAENGVAISTSLDGPADLHNRNRPRRGRSSHALALEGIRRARAVLGNDRVAALMTTTEASLGMAREIVDEYVSQGFASIFLRSVSPYGFAVRTGESARYHTAQWLDFYRTALAHIIELNRRGTTIREEYSSIVLRKILTPWPSGYVDLQSPAGLGIGALLFNYDRGIYASDEARMLAEMGDQTFRLGTLGADSYEQIMTGDKLLGLLLSTMTEGTPMCSDCGIQPYCGSDPVGHYATQRDVVGFKPTSAFCSKSMGVVRHLVRLLEDDSDSARVLRSWVAA